MTINGLGLISGQGSISIQAATPSGYSISFSTYNALLPATMSGSAPTISNQSAGATFTVPGAGTLTRTEIAYSSPPGGGDIIQTPTNVTLRGWTDGSALYLPGSVYTMPSNNITFTAIWNHLYSPTITSISPESLAIGGTLTIYGVGLGSVSEVKFQRNKISTSVTVINDEEIRAVMPALSITGPVVVTLFGGGSDVTPSLTKI
jgi:hypothetical protein